MAKKQPKFDGIIRDVRVRVYATRDAYEVVFNDDDYEDPNANVLCYPKLGAPDAWAAQGRMEYEPADD